MQLKPLAQDILTSSSHSHPGSSVQNASRKRPREDSRINPEGDPFSRPALRKKLQSRSPFTLLRDVAQNELMELESGPSSSSSSRSAPEAGVEPIRLSRVLQRTLRSEEPSFSFQEDPLEAATPFSRSELRKKLQSLSPFTLLRDVAQNELRERESSSFSSSRSAPDTREKPIGFSRILQRTLPSEELSFPFQEEAQTGSFNRRPQSLLEQNTASTSIFCPSSSSHSPATKMRDFNRASLI